jgi:hypothetical protein
VKSHRTQLWSFVQGKCSVKTLFGGIGPVIPTGPVKRWKGSFEKMPLLPVPLRSLFAPSPVAAPRRAAPPHLLLGRRSPLAGALLFLSLGAVTGCALSHCRVPFLGSPPPSCSFYHLSFVS